MMRPFSSWNRIVLLSISLLLSLMNVGIIVFLKDVSHLLNGFIEIAEYVIYTVLFAYLFYFLLTRLQQQARNIVYRKETKELLLTSDALKVTTQLAAGIAHEIRNTLTSLKRFLYLIKKGQIKDEYLQIMDMEFTRIETILNELLILSKPASKAFTPIFIQDLVQQVISLMEPHARIHSVEFECSYPVTPIQIAGDSKRLKQALINLVKNAIEVNQVDWCPSISKSMTIRPFLSW